MATDRATPGVEPRKVVALTGVYDADGTVMGELSYFIGARLGRAHCSLCDITHGLVRAKAEWTACRATLAIPFDTYHRNDVPAPVLAAIGAELPAVVARLEDGSVVVLLGRDQLDACGGSLDEMLRRMRTEAGDRQLELDLGTEEASAGD